MDTEIKDTKYNSTLIIKKLQILYTYSQKTPKTFSDLLQCVSEWDPDCKYALLHMEEFDIKKLL